MHFPFVRLGGRYNFTPAHHTLLQTSVHKNGNAYILLFNNSMKRLHIEHKPVDNTTNTDAEWQGLLYGVSRAIERGDKLLAIENNHAPIMTGLMVHGTTFRGSGKSYKKELFSMLDSFDWVGVRLIDPGRNYSAVKLN
jgi:hypothetical protein